MNNSAIDVLLQIPVPRVEPAPAGGRGRDESSAFDNHFRQASNPGTSPPPTPATSQPSQNSTDSPSDNSSETPAAPADRSSTTQSNTSTEPATASDPSTTSPAAADEQKISIDTERDEDATEVEALAALAVVEQIAETAPSDLAGDANDTPSDQSDAAPPANSDHEKRPRSNAANSSARDIRPAPASDGPAEAPRDQNAESDGPSDAAQTTAKDGDAKQPSTSANRDAEPIASPVETSPAVTETADAENASQPKTRRDQRPQEHQATSASAAKHSAAQPAAAPAGTIEQPIAAKKSAGEPIGDASARKGDKKIGSRSTASPAEASATPAERPAAIATTADATAASSAPAGSQPQLPAANVAASATTNSAGKSQDTQSASKQGFLSPFARLERGTQSARGANHTGAADGPRHVDPARFVSRVARAIHTAQERGGPLQLRLSPPELGAMRLELSLNQGALTATIETENSTTRQLLLDNLPALRERLAEQNVKIERFDVDVRRDPTGNQQNTAPQDRGQAEHHDRRPGRNFAPRSTAAAPIEETAPVRRTITVTSINVVA